MKFLVVVQDLRISGTSEGIVSRSFLAKLRHTHPEANIDVIYLAHFDSDDRLDLLPVNSILKTIIDTKIPFFTKWINKLYWRITHLSLNHKYIREQYRKALKNLNHEDYDHIFIRSSGLEYETIQGAIDLPILKHAIINFHDPYPVFWDTGSNVKLTGLTLFRLKIMWEVVSQAKSCISPSQLLSEDLQHLYGSHVDFKILPHQYSSEVFDFSQVKGIRKKEKKISISYHGVIQFGRNIDILIDAYLELLAIDHYYKKETELVLRLRGMENQRLLEKYADISNVIILDSAPFANSCLEQTKEADILIALENSFAYCNILGGKTPFLASLKKPVLALSPERSELRRIIKDTKYIARSNDVNEIMHKLKILIDESFKSGPVDVYPFGDYFEIDNFKRQLNKIIHDK
jgi:glycosyltransferase involved in cell wall biosynthesis